MYALAWSATGEQWASGGADHTVFLRQADGQPTLKYTHKSSIQALAFNPVTEVLASASCHDVGFWAPKKLTVAKTPMPAKVLSLSWTPDGRFLAVGMENGCVQLLNDAGEAAGSFTVPGPVWTLAWCPARSGEDVLAVGNWAVGGGAQKDATNQLTFWSLEATQVHKSVPLSAPPCAIAWWNGGQYLAVSTGSKSAMLYTVEGVELGCIAQSDGWGWSMQQRPGHNQVALGCNSGAVSVHTVTFATVHGLYQDRYAWRDGMTEVVVQHLLTDRKVRIRCRDYVKKIAVYRNRLAVQLKSRVLVYELAGGADDPYDMHYRVRQRLNEAVECNLLVVTAAHVILCHDTKLQLFDYAGLKEREWVMESVIRYIKVVGGPPGSEALLVGLKSGAVLKVFIDNPFPVPLLQVKDSVRCLDTSVSKRMVAVVDASTKLTVFDTATGEVAWTADGALAVAFNSQMEESCAYSTRNELALKVGEFPESRQRASGFVVGFNGSKVYALQHSIQSIDIPQSASMQEYMARRDLSSAYKVACLGVTAADWKALGVAAAQALDLQLARKAFMWVKDMRHMELVATVERVLSGATTAAGESIEPAAARSLALGEILAYEGSYEEASRQFVAAGQHERAITMWSDLRCWEKARTLAEASGGRVNVRVLLNRQAALAAEAGDIVDAADIYATLGEYQQAITLLGQQGELEGIAKVVRQLDSSDASTAALKSAAGYFRAAGRAGSRYAKETYLKMGDIGALLDVYVENKEWDEALALAEAVEHRSRSEAMRSGSAGTPEPDARGADGAKSTATAAAHTGSAMPLDAALALRPKVYLPYAEWLITQDNFEAARAAFSTGGRADMASALQSALAAAAVSTGKHEAAAHGYRRLANEALTDAESCASMVERQDAGGGAREAERIRDDGLARWHALRTLADVHIAYSCVVEYVDAPFTQKLGDTLLAASAFVVNTLVTAGHAADSAEEESGSAAVSRGVALRAGVGAVSQLSVLRRPPRWAASATAAAGMVVGGKLQRPSRWAGAGALTQSGVTGVSVVKCLYALGRQAISMGAWRTARAAFDKLDELRYPTPWRDTVEFNRLLLLTKPYADSEGAAAVCYRCGAPLQQLHGKGKHACQHCGNPVVRCGLTWDLLPLVEWTPHGMTVKETLEAVSSDAQTKQAGGAGRGSASDGWAQAKSGQADMLVMNQGEEMPEDDMPGMTFDQLLQSGDVAAQDQSAGAVPVPRGTLATMSRRCIRVSRWDKVHHALAPQFFYNVLSEISVSACTSCWHMFHTEDLEQYVLEKHACPTCGEKVPSAADDTSPDGDGVILWGA